MKILFIGEYSGAYKTLIKFMKSKNIEIFWLHDGDGYKNIQGADYSIKFKKIKSKYKVIAFILKFYYLFLEIMGIKGFLQIRKYDEFIETLKDYDVVQLVNTKPLGEYSSLANIYFLKKIFKNNKKVYLSALGDDYTWVNECLRGGFRYSIFDRINYKNFFLYSWPLLYVYGLGYRKLNNYVIDNVQAIIPGLYDYYIAYKNNNIKKLTKIVPIAIEKRIDKPLCENKIEFPIKIFHGWQKNKDLRKGNDIFDEAIKSLQLKYPKKIEYIIVSNVSYDEYLEKFNSSHIFIDQCFSMDMGVNGLLGLSSGKVVFTGFESEVKMYYGVNNEKIAINALPDVDRVFNDLENFIIKPSLINEYSLGALNFIENYHSPEYVLKEFLSIWQNDLEV